MIIKAFGDFYAASQASTPRMQPLQISVSNTRDFAPAHAQRIIGITDTGDRGLIALQARQAYVLEVAR
ncbi:hypothetical protein PMm318_A31430 [Pseudomonas moorei]